MQTYVIKDDGTTSIKINQNGIVINKKVATVDFYDQLLKGLHRDAYIFKSGQLPSNTVNIVNTSEGTSVTLFLPKTQRNMLTTEGLYLNVGNPAYIMRFTYGDNIIKKTEICAVIANSFSDLNKETKIFKFPFGNMLSNLTACTGNIQVAANCPKDMDSAVHTFWNSKFNGETNPGALPLIKVLENKVFTDELLINTEIGNLEQFL
ncbi:hypothetical protein [Lactiplantibacillus plantarum]|uniref:hypothetical protein n=1 Tax=Lactiplantibacillus plantarum TaxID=1590 RepID=UPI00207410B5|nr:hypothetical protein [Lactiplantibacillus plantarum]